MTDFFTFDDTKAGLVVQNLLLINLCGNIVVPDPKNLPAGVFCQTNALFSIIYSRYIRGQEMMRGGQAVMRGGRQ